MIQELAHLSKDRLAPLTLTPNNTNTNTNATMGVWRDYSCVCRTLVPTSIFIGSRDQGVLIAKVKVVWSQGGRDQSTGVVGQPLDLPSLIISGWDAFLQMV